MTRDDQTAADSTTGDKAQPVGQDGYKVIEGECLESIAFKHGFFPETLWNLGENQELKKAREDSACLLPGDRVFIPKLRPRQEDCSTGASYSFKRKGVPSTFEVQILTGDEPRADEPFILMIDGRSHEGRTDADGWIRVSISPGAAEGVLTVGEGIAAECYELEFGGMDPVKSIAGIQKRLENLGYECGTSGELDDETRDALREFQQVQKLEMTGEPDETTIERLLDIHGS